MSIENKLVEFLSLHINILNELAQKPGVTLEELKDGIKRLALKKDTFMIDADILQKSIDAATPSQV